MTAMRTADIITEKLTSAFSPQSLNVAVAGKDRVVTRHSDAVIGDADARAPAVGDVDVDGAGARVEGVFEELFDDRCRPLDDLARRDLIDDGRREDGDARHA